MFQDKKGGYLGDGRKHVMHVMHEALASIPNIICLRFRRGSGLLLVWSYLKNKKENQNKPFPEDKKEQLIST